MLHFSSSAQRPLDVTATSYVELADLVDSLPEDSTDRACFRLSWVTREEVLKTIKTLKYDCSSGPDQTPTKSVKLVAGYLVEPLTIIVNGCITNVYFRKLRKIARVSSISEVDNPITNDQFRPISILPVLSKGE